MNVKIAIADDNSFLIHAVKEKLSFFEDLNVKFSALNGSELLVKLEENHHIDLILMDIEMPGMTGIEAVKLIKHGFPQIQVLMQTVFEDDDRVFDSICAGASGYILKNHINTKLVESIREVQYGGSPMSPSIARKVLSKMQQIPQFVKPEEAPDYHLTAREKEVLLCIVNGLAYKMIADQLNISYETVRSHVKKIYEKLHVASLTEAVAKAINQRIV